MVFMIAKYFVFILIGIVALLDLIIVAIIPKFPSGLKFIGATTIIPGIIYIPAKFLTSSFSTQIFDLLVAQANIELNDQSTVIFVYYARSFLEQLFASLTNKLTFAGIAVVVIGIGMIILGSLLTGTAKQVDKSAVSEPK